MIRRRGRHSHTGVVVMQHGRVVEQGTTEDVLRRPATYTAC